MTNGSALRLADGESALLIGADSSGSPVFWHEARSLITVGPSGCGKTRGHVFPNLARWRGSAVVLDIKGECYAETADIRSQYGRVIRFDPAEPGLSAAYNPLAAVRRSELDIWEDSRTVAEALVRIPRGSGSNEFFYSAARNLVQLCVAYARWTSPSATIRDVIGYVSSFSDESAPDDPGAIPINDLAASDREDGSPHYPVEFNYAAQQFKRLLNKSDGDVFGSIAATADAALAPLMGARIASVLSNDGVKPTWRPADLRSPGTTVYLCVPDTEIARLGPLLNLIIGQHIAGLMGRENENAENEVLFVLDEVAQLGRMAPISTALEVGRAYKLRLWLLVQTLAQLRDPHAYGRDGADTLLANCALKAFMNPDPTTALELAKLCGERPHAWKDGPNPAVFARDLAGDAWRDDMLVFLTGENPRRLRKVLWEGS